MVLEAYTGKKSLCKSKFDIPLEKAFFQKNIFKEKCSNAESQF